VGCGPPSPNRHRQPSSRRRRARSTSTANKKEKKKIKEKREREERNDGRRATGTTGKKNTIIINYYNYKNNEDDHPPIYLKIGVWSPSSATTIRARTSAPFPYVPSLSLCCFSILSRSRTNLEYFYVMRATDAGRRVAWPRAVAAAFRATEPDEPTARD
jgi:hypothetical protein